MSDRERSDVRNHWERAAKTPAQDGLKPTARDRYLQQAVEDAIEKRLPKGCRLLDIGCGDGASTLRFAQHAGDVLGVDYVAGFVDRARASCPLPTVCFRQADVLDLSPILADHGQYDVVTSIRCLINLTSWDEQKRGIDQIASLVRPGGLYMASEGWQEGLEGLNARRGRCGLPDIAVAQYNLLMRRHDFEAAVSQHFELVGYDSMGLYLFLSRVLQPLYTFPAPPRHDHPLNAVASALQCSQHLMNDFSDCDYAGVYVFKRKG